MAGINRYLKTGFYIAIALILLNWAMIGRQYHWLVILLFCYWLYRCYCLHSQELWGMLVISLLLFGLLFYHTRQQLQAPYDEAKQEIQGILYPDSLHYDNGYITGKLWHGSFRRSKIRFKAPQMALEEPVKISGRAQCSNGEQQRNPTCYDERLMLVTHHYQKQIFLKEAHFERVVSLPFSIRLSLWRKKGVDRVCHYCPPTMAKYMLSLILGYRNDEFKQSIGMYQSLGLVHLFSLSGFHVSLLLLMFRYFLLRIGLLRDHLLWLECGLLILYFVFTGSLISVFRSGVQYQLRAVERRYHLEWNPFDIWGWSVILGLMFYPTAFITAAGLLTYGLSFALLASQQRIQEPSVMGWFQKTLWLTWFSLPVISYYFHEVSVIGIWLNMVSFTLFSILIPLLFIGLMMLLFFPPALFYFVWLEVGLRWLESFLWWISQNVTGTIVTGTFSTIALILWGLSLFRHQTLYIKYGLFFFGMVAIFGKQWLNPYTKVSFIDVGQGDSILIQLAHQRGNFLIDTGGKVTFGRSSSTSNATYTVIPYLKSEGIRQLDAIFLTHADADHMGDIIEVARAMKPKVIYYPPGCEQKASFRRKMEQLSSYHWQEWQSGKQYQSQELNLTCLWPLSAGQGDNEHSLVLMAAVENWRFLLTGDLGIVGEKELLQCYPNLKADVLKVGHHGSRHSTSEEWLKQVQPKIGVISCGRHNRFSHPHREVMERLQQANIKVLRTDNQGQIQFVFWNHHLQSVNGRHE